MKQVFNKAISDQGARFHPTFGVDVRDAGELPLFETKHNPKVGQFGYTRTNKDGSRKYHGGIDICGSVGSPIYAAHSGKISRAGYQVHPGPEGSGFGLRVYVDGDMVQSLYGHLSGIIISVGDVLVVPGQLIGFMGRSGNLDRLTKTHVHFEIRLWDEEKKQFMRIDPELWLDWKEST